MSDAMNAMEKLLHEADTKFAEKLKLCQGGVATNMNIYSDRSYNLRQQVAHNPQLTNDDHFMEMLCDTEQALTPEYMLRGEVDKKLTSLLCGLVKTLLREAVAQPMYAVRKIQIEMIWQWYEDKKRHVLDFIIGTHRANNQQQQQQNKKDAYGASLDTLQVTVAGGVSQCGPNESTESRATSLRPSSLQAPTDRPAAVTSSVPPPHSKYGARLRQYVSDPSGVTATSPVGSVASSHHFTTATLDLAIRDDSSVADARSTTTAKKLTLYKKRNLSKAEKLRQELAATAAASTNPGLTSHNSDVKVVYTKDAKARQKKASEARSHLVAMRHGPSGPASFVHHESGAPFFTRDEKDRKALENAVANAHQHIARHLTAKMSDDGDKRDLRDSMTMFDFNRSRLEEETNRRLESETYASQLGRTCHTNLRKVGTTAAAPVQPAAASGGGDASKPSPMHFNIGSAVKPAGGGGGTQGSLATMSEDVAAQLGHNVYRPPNTTTLSPYDNRHMTRLDEAKLQMFLRRHTPAASGTTRSVSSLSAATGGAYGVVDDGDLAERAALHTIGAVAASSALDVTLAPDAKVTATAPRLDIPIVDMLLGSTDADKVVPSTRKLEELRMATRVREAFASDRKPGARPGSAHHYPRSKIERAVTTPDDHALGDCLRLLPTYGSFLPRRPSTAKR